MEQNGTKEVEEPDERPQQKLKFERKMRDFAGKFPNRRIGARQKWKLIGRDARLALFCNLQNQAE